MSHEAFLPFKPEMKWRESVKSFGHEILSGKDSGKAGRERRKTIFASFAVDFDSWDEPGTDACHGTAFPQRRPAKL